MSLRADRQQTQKAILEGRFIKKVLQENAEDIDQDIQQKTAGFSSPIWSMRNFAVIDNKMVYTHPKVMRFLDMKTRQSVNGINRKKRHKVHNAPIYGHLNNIIRQLNFGFTEAIKNDLSQLDNTQL